MAERKTTATNDERGHARFLEGRDLAVKLLRQAESVRDAADERASFRAQYRQGPQENYVLHYLERIAQRPELAAGFSAVLSDWLYSGYGLDPEVYEDLTIGQMLGARHDQGFVRLLGQVLDH
jgi:hypothetical protein